MYKGLAEEHTLFLPLGKDPGCQGLVNTQISQFSSQGPFLSDLSLPFRSHSFIHLLTKFLLRIYCVLGIFTYVNLQFWPNKSNVLGNCNIYIPASLPLLMPLLSLEKTLSLLLAYWILSKPQESARLIFLKKHQLSIQSVSGTVLALCRSNTTHTGPDIKELTV